MKSFTESQPEKIWKGTDFWKQEINTWIQEQELDDLPFYNDVVGENRAPHPDSGYGEPLIRDAVLDGEVCDVYHSDHAGGTWHRVFIHHKGENTPDENLKK